MDDFNMSTHFDQQNRLYQGWDRWYSQCVELRDIPQGKTGQKVSWELEKKTE